MSLLVTLHNTVTSILFQSESYSMAPWPVPQGPPSFLRVVFWFLKFYKPLHDLSPGKSQLVHLSQLVSTHPPPCPSTLSASATPVLAAAQTSGTFLEGADQNLLIAEPFPDACHPPLPPSLSFFTALIITWHRIFPTLYCVFPSIIVCISFSYILFRVVPLLKKLCSQNQKDTFW